MKINQFKMAFLAWCAVFPMILCINVFLIPYLLELHVVLRTFIITLILIPYMILLAIPFIRKKFSNWLSK
jgi:antibiotic biosynthesis monooxygenase (ABM) superfamily enzyme